MDSLGFLSDDDSLPYLLEILYKLRQLAEASSVSNTKAISQFIKILILFSVVVCLSVDTEDCPKDSPISNFLDDQCVGETRKSTIIW